LLFPTLKVHEIVYYVIIRKNEVKGAKTMKTLKEGTKKKERENEKEEVALRTREVPPGFFPLDRRCSRFKGISSELEEKLLKDHSYTTYTVLYTAW
jgi:hypothetical protein